MVHDIIRTSQFIKLYDNKYIPIVKTGSKNWLDNKGNVAYDEHILTFCNREEYPKFAYTEQEILSFVEAEMQQTIKNAKESALNSNEKVPTDAEILEYYTSYHYFTVNSENLYATSYDKYVKFLKKCIKDAIYIEDFFNVYNNFKSLELSINNGSSVIGEYKAYSFFKIDINTINDTEKMLTATEMLYTELNNLVEYMNTGKATYKLYFKTTDFSNKLVKKKKEKVVTNIVDDSNIQFILRRCDESTYYVKDKGKQVILSGFLPQAKLFKSEKVANNKIQKIKKTTGVDFMLLAID